MNLGRHKNTLYRLLGEDTIKMLKTSNAIIAGGAITSIFSGNEVNDYDIYFRCKKDIITFIRNAYSIEGDLEDSEDPFPLSEEDYLDMSSYEFICHNHTSRSITFVHDDTLLQLIHFDYFSEPSKIFESFDFHINMGSFDFSTEQFVLHDQFITDVSERRLTFNEGTRYPIMSSLRVSKYLERGYKISKKEMFKIGMCMADLNINSWAELEDQLSGFYGIDVSEFFDHSIPFSMDVAYVMIDSVHEYTKTPEPSNPSIGMLFFTILGNPNPEQRIYFKYVRTVNDTYQDIYNNDEVYRLNETVFYKDGVDVQDSITKVNANHYYRSSNGFSVAILQMADDAIMTMAHGGLRIRGKVKFIGIHSL